MGLPAQELYFSDENSQALQNNVQKTNQPTFIEPAPVAKQKDKIKIIGIGGGGRNTLNHIIASGVDNVDFLTVDTDVRNLEMSQSPNKVILGTRGIGAGCIPKNGEEAAKQSLDEVMEFLKGADMVYLTAGMGGGTGTGVIPVIAQAAYNMGILTVAVVTKPFAFEGMRKMRMAQEGIDKLRGCVDALMVIPNEKLLEISDEDAGIQEAFAMANEVLRQAIIGVTELVTKAGMVNMDFADIKAVMRHSGIAVMGMGRGRGENRVENALKQAMESPLMETKPVGASGVLMNITSDGSLTLFELQQAAANIQDCIGEDATFVWGTVNDPEMGSDVKITIIATGLDETAPQQDTDDFVQQGTEENVSENIEQEPVEEFVTVKPQPRNIATESRESFLPFWMRSEESEAQAKEEITDKTNEDRAKTEEQPIVFPKEQLFEEQTMTEFDVPSIRRKKTAPRLD